MNNSLAPLLIERHDRFRIARDDLLPGGTKRRALCDYLPTLNCDHFIYVGSVYGSGGWALAEACKDLGFGYTLYIPRSDYEPSWLTSSLSVIRTDPQPVQTLYGSLAGARGLLPLGFDDPDFKKCLAGIMKKADAAPPEIWLPCVSGVMVGAARMAWPDCRVNAVCVAKHHGDLGAAVKYQAQEKYHQPARVPAPYPANPFSDAKLWSFAREFALKDALIWNTSS